MKTFLKGLALLAVVTSVVWIAVIWRWQATHREMTTDDLVVYLILLPLVVFALALGLRWAVRGAMAKQAAAMAAAAEGAQAAAASGGPGPSGKGQAGQSVSAQSEARERTLAWPVFGAWASGPAGDDMAAILDAAKAGKPSPVPDKLLRDGHGLPVMCARAEAIDEAPVERAWNQWRQSRGAQAAGSSRALPAHVSRALSALEPLLQQAGSQVEDWAQTLPQDARPVARVRVLATWPAAWSEAEQAWARAWLEEQIKDLRHDAIGPDRWPVHALPPGSGPQAWQLADRLLVTLEREQCDDLVLLLACHSDLSDSAVDALERQGRLFSANEHPKGQMPGEGAAALLLGRSGLPQDAKQRGAIAWVHRAACGRRDKSVDAPGRTSADTARQVAADAIMVAGVSAAELGGLCCDADRHTPRATELFATTIELLPDLDPTEDMRLIGAAQGHAQHTGAMWAVAGAVAQAVAAERPAVALSLADEHWRMALVARHQPAPAAATAASSAA